MIVMVFEYRVQDDYYEEYLKEAMNLRPHLNEIEGFMSIERFESKTEPGKLVSIGYFADEKAVAAWRNTPEHRRVQELGRKRLFTDYLFSPGVCWMGLILNLSGSFVQHLQINSYGVSPLSVFSLRP